MPTPDHRATLAIATSLVALVACGDDTSGPSSSGNGGATSGSQVATASSSSGGETSTGGEGAAGHGGFGASGGGDAGGAGGGQEVGRLGDPCEIDADCDDGLCLTEAEVGLPGGACTRRCDLSQADGACPEGLCEEREPFGQVCIATCDPAAPACRDAYTCRPQSTSDTDWACRARCEDDAQCPVTGLCSRGLCYFPEAECEGLIDDDVDGRLDCGDDDCADDPACAGGQGDIGAPCDAHADCLEGMICLDEMASGAPHGMCVLQAEGGECPEGTHALYSFIFETELGIGAADLCITECATDPDVCREGFQCQSGGCRPACTLDEQCASGFCFEGWGECLPAEICDDGIDNTGLGGVDCQVDTCVETCESAFADACAAAAPLPATAELESLPGQHLECGGIGGALQLFAFTADARGEVTVAVQAETPHWLGVADACDVADDIFICEDNASPFVDGVVELVRFIDAGQTLWFSVASSAQYAGPFTISSSFVAD